MPWGRPSTSWSRSARRLTGHGRQDILRRISREEPPPPRRLDPAIPRDLETIILKAMAKEPGGRYASAAGLAEDLRSFAEGRPIRARRPASPERISRWMRRHQAASAAAAAVLILAVAGLSVGSALLWREQRRTRGNLEVALQALDDFGLASGAVGVGRDPERTQELRDLQANSVRIYERLIRQNPADPGPRWARRGPMNPSATSSSSSTDSATPRRPIGRRTPCSRSWATTTGARPDIRRRPRRRPGQAGDHARGGPARPARPRGCFAGPWRSTGGSSRPPPPIPGSGWP